MYKYEVGQIVNDFKQCAEGVRFDISDDGAIIIAFFQSPTAKEIEQFKQGKAFEIRFIELYGVIIITVKIGNLNWMDAPYTPHLSPNFTKFQIPNQNQGLRLTLILVDVKTGEIKHIRLLVLSVKFTRQLLELTTEHKAKEFNLSNYDNSIRAIFSAYPTKQIVKMSKSCCKIND